MPSIIGIWISIRIKSNFSFEALSTASIPFLTDSKLYSLQISFSNKLLFKSLLSTIKTFLFFITLLWIFDDKLNRKFILSNPSYLILVVGPTAVGKTDLCLNLAKKFKTEIVSCDSRQFYREMILGTAKPSSKELEDVPHHFINSLSIDEEYDVRRFEREALTLLDELFEKHQVVIMTGGSGLFADAIVNGLDDIPKVAPE